MKRGTIRFLLVLAIAGLLRAFVAQGFRIPGAAMAPTLEPGDHLLCSKRAYGTRIPGTERVLWASPPHRGDVVVFRYPDDRSIHYVKRIIGLPGETIEIRNRRILIDGTPIDDPWGACEDGLPITDPTAACRNFPRADSFAPFSIPEDRYFMLGDNRQSSLDSRFWRTARTVPRSDILCRAGRIYLARDWTRIGEAVR